MRVSGVHARVVLIAYLMAIMATLVVAIIHSETARAAQLTTRSLTLRQHTGVTSGGSAPGVKADHKFGFTVTTTAGINSIGVQYCDNPDGACTTTGNATGIDISTGSGASLDATSTNLGSTPGYTSTAANAGYVHFTAPLAGVGVVFQLDNVTNPSTANATFYVHITTYTSANATTGSTDTGTVAASTTTTILVTGVMPEYLQFCTGGTVTVNCGSTSSGSISFDQDFSTAVSTVAFSQMAAATNAGNGYSIVAEGTTLTSGSNTIPQVGTTAVTSTTHRGTQSEFGINLTANTATTSSVGSPIWADPTPASNTTDKRALVTSQYNQTDKFALDLSGATAIANSDNNTPGTAHPTLSQVYTVTYMANVSGIQPPGTYVATINYVCTPTY